MSCNNSSFIFLKTGYDTYYELCLRLMRKGGIVAFDNTLQGGKVIIEEEQAEHILAIRNLNDKLSKDDRVTAVMMNIGDGYTLVTKL